MMQPIRMRTAIEMRLFTSGKASSSSPVLVLKVPIVDQDATHKVYSSLEIESWNRSRGAMTVQTFSSRLSGSFFFSEQTGFYTVDCYAYIAELKKLPTMMRLFARHH